MLPAAICSASSNRPPMMVGAPTVFLARWYTSTGLGLPRTLAAASAACGVIRLDPTRRAAPLQRDAWVRFCLHGSERGLLGARSKRGQSDRATETAAARDRRGCAHG